jgi:hypothetical protein
MLSGSGWHTVYGLVMYPVYKFIFQYIKQGDLHRRSIARRVKMQSEKGPYQPEPDNIDHKPINQTSVNCGPLNNTPVNHPSVFIT